MFANTILELMGNMIKKICHFGEKTFAIHLPNFNS